MEKLRLLLAASHSSARSGDFTTAERAELEAQRIAPNEPRVLFRLATARLGLHRYGAAYLDYRSAYARLIAAPSSPASSRTAYYSFMCSAAAMAEEKGDASDRATVASAPPLALAEPEVSSAAPREPPTPVTILSGFLGAGKTTLLRRILRSGAGGRTAVIVNDMAALNVDAEIVRRDVDAGIVASVLEVVELSNGCVCCTLRGELLDALASLAAARDATTGARRWTRILVESSGISEPLPVAQAFVMQPHAADGARPPSMTLGSLAAIEAMVTVVDASSFERECSSAELLSARGVGATAADARTIAQLMVDQVEFADVLILNKCDLASPAAVRRAADVLRCLNPRAECIEARHCEGFDLAQILGAQRFDLRRAVQSAGWRRELLGEHTPESEALGLGSFVYRRRGPFDAAKLRGLARGWPVTVTGVGAGTAPGTAPGEERAVAHGGAHRVLRSKGFVWIAEDSRFALEWATAGPHCTLKAGAVWKAAVGAGAESAASPGAASAAAASPPPRPHDTVWGDRCVEIVFIGIALQRAEIEAALDAAMAQPIPDTLAALPQPCAEHALSELPSLRKLATRFAADLRVDAAAKARWAGVRYPEIGDTIVGADPPRELERGSK